MIPTTRRREPMLGRMRIATLFLAATLAACGDSNPDPDDPMVIEIESENGTVFVEAEVADSDAERAKGLMGRTSLDADAGMVFLWEGPVETTFWMKGTLIQLSIAFWNERGRIIEIVDMAPCRQDDCPSYGPDEPFVGALEVNRGFFDDHGVEIGDRVFLENQ
jgi:uncharacterized membrane protein (UPF0127 family)